MYWNPAESEKKVDPPSLVYIIHLHIPILFIVIMFGETAIKLIMKMICSPYRAHTGPLFFANRILSVTQINTYMVGTYMYKCLNESFPQFLSNYFTRNNSIHEYSTRGTNEIHVPFGRLHIRKFSIRINGAKVWNSLPSFVKQSRSLELFKNTLRNYLFSSESVVIVTQFWWFYNPICFVLKVL